MSKRYLVLEDGNFFEGEAFGGSRFSIGRLIFNTDMNGYQRILCDSANSGQIINFTYPLIGNAGINRDGAEGLNPHIFGVIVSDVCDNPSNFTSRLCLDEFLRLKNIPGIKDIDTRHITKKIIKSGTMNACLTDNISNIDVLVEQIKNYREDKSIVSKVSVQKPFHIQNDNEKIIVIDLGSINDIVKELNSKNLDITILPYDVSFEYIVSLNPDGIILSDGPGRPEFIEKTIELCKLLMGNVPIFGIGLGHLVLAKACGCEIKKLKYGHRGNNYPVKNVIEDIIEIVGKNNSYTIDKNNMPSDIRVLYRDINDDTIDGFDSIVKNIMAIQFKPALDSYVNKNKHFAAFYKMIENSKEAKNA